MTALALLLLAPLSASVAPIQDSASDDGLVIPSKGDVPGEAAVDEAVQKAVALLVASQESYVPDKPVGRLSERRLARWQTKERERLAGLHDTESGVEWPYEGVYRVGPDGRIPGGYRVGGTGIVCLALMDAPGYAKDEARQAAVQRSLAYVLDMLDEEPTLEPGPKEGYDVRGWGHTYVLRFLLRAKALKLVPEELEERVEAAIPHLFACLKTNENRGGGWNYANTNSCSPFMTASTLIALYQARDQGYEVDAAMVERALDALERGRDEDSGSYTYSIGRRSRGAEPMESSSARSAAAELVLFHAGRSDSDDLERAVNGFFSSWDDLYRRKSQQGTHEPPYGIAPYYFFYGHTYAALAIEALPKDERAKYREMMNEHLWRTLEDDGGWNDRIFPRTKSYSTAMAILALEARDLPAVPDWEAPPAAKKARDAKAKAGEGEGGL